MITFDRDQLDADIKLRVPLFAKYDATEFDNLRAQAYRKAMANYQSELIDANDPWVRRTTLDEVAAPSTGAIKLDTSIGDLFVVALLADALQIADDTVLVKSSTSLVAVPRVDLDDIVAGTTTAGFIEHKGGIQIYCADGMIVADSDLHYNYFVTLDAEPATGATVLDLKPQDYEAILTATVDNMKEDAGL